MSHHYYPDFYETAEGKKALATHFPHLEIITDLEIGSDKWKELSLTGVGGSEVAGILGESDYDATPLQVYSRKKGLIPGVVATEKMELAQAFEDPIAVFYAKRHPDEAVTPGFWFRDKQSPWMIGDPDRIIWNLADMTPKGILEIKCPGLRQADKWGEEEAEEYPLDYMFQLAWYMAACDLQVGKLVPVIGGEKYLEYKFPRNEELEVAMVDNVQRWWYDHYMHDNPPPASPVATDSDVLNSVFPVSKEKLQHQATAEELQSVHSLMDLYATKQAAEKAYKSHVAIVKEIMGEAEVMATDAGKIYWKTTKPSEKTDWKKAFDYLAQTFKGDDQQFVEQTVKMFTETKPGSRRFRPYPKEEK